MGIIQRTDIDQNWYELLPVRQTFLHLRCTKFKVIFVMWNYEFPLILFTLFSPSKVRGMMYIRQALELQAFLDMAKDEGTHHKRFIER